MDRTLTLQRPNMMLEKRIDVGTQVVSTELATTSENPVSHKNDVVKRIKTEPGTEQPVLEVQLKPLEEENNVNYKMVEVTEKRRIPWFAGCEYKCRYEECEEMFFYNQDLRNHIKKVHGDLDDYLDKFKVFETKDEYIACKECFLNLKRHFSSVFLHLRDKHDNMTILEYAKKHKMKDYDKTYKVIKKKPQTNEKSDKSTAALSKKRKGSVSPAPSTESKKSRKTPSRTSTPVEPLTPSLTRVESPASPTPPVPPKVSECPNLSPASTNNNPKSSEEKISSDQLIIQKPWFSGCEYECQLCNKIFFELNELLFHVRNQHNMTAKPYQKKFFKFETQKAFYQCKLCFSKIKHTKTFITNHLAANHNGMKLNAYEEVFHPPNGSSGSQLAEEKAMGKSADQSTNEIMMSSEKFKDWARGTCQFQCKVCSFTTGGSVDFWKHVKNTHELEIQVYKDTHGNPCIVMNKIICKGCQRVLRYDYGTLLGHASTKHNMTLIEFYNTFYKKFIEGNTIPVSPASPEKPSTIGEGVSPIRKYVEDALNEETKSANLVPMLQRGGSDLKKRAHLWGWRCQYKCAVCSRSFSSRVGIQKHVNLAHNVSLQEYTGKYGSTMTKKVHHACFICEQKVLHDPSAIAMHIRSSHRMTYEDYYVRYVEGGGGGGVVKQNGKTPKTKIVPQKPAAINGVQKAVVKPMMNFNRIRQQSRKPRIGKTHHSGREEHFKWVIIS